MWRHGEHQREEEGWGSEDTSCYTNEHPTSSADVTEIGEEKGEKMSHSWPTACIIEVDKAQHLNTEAEKCGKVQHTFIY